MALTIYGTASSDSRWVPSTLDTGCQTCKGSVTRSQLKITENSEQVARTEREKVVISIAGVRRTGGEASHRLTEPEKESSGGIMQQTLQDCWAKGRQRAASSDKAQLHIGRTSGASLITDCIWLGVIVTLPAAGIACTTRQHHGSLATTAFIVFTATPPSASLLREVCRFHKTYPRGHEACISDLLAAFAPPGKIMHLAAACKTALLSSHARLPRPQRRAATWGTVDGASAAPWPARLLHRHRSAQTKPTED